jgi:hypothetical protein
MYDFGCSQDFSPTNFIKENILPYLSKYNNCQIAQTIVSHPHADHISEIESLVEKEGKISHFHSALHTCPHDKNEGSVKPEQIDWARIKNPEGSEENIELYKKIYSARSLPLQTICYDSSRSIPNLEYGIFYVRPPVVNKIHPKNDQDYGNGMSLVLFYRHGIHTLLIPGDITPDCLNHLLNEKDGLEKRYTIFDHQKSSEHTDWHSISSNQPTLKKLLQDFGLSILIAPHHGLESGFSEDLYLAMKNEKPNLVVISDKRHENTQDGSIHTRYQSSDGASGLTIDIEGKKENSYSISTRNGYHILISFEGTGGVPEIYMDRKPENILKKIEGYTSGI